MSKSKQNLKVVKDEVTETASENTQETPQTPEVPEYKFISSEEAKLLSNEELEAKIKELESVVDSMGKEIQSKKYPVAVGDIKSARTLLKFLEKSVRWSHQTLPGYISVVHSLKDAIKDGVSEEGNIFLGGGPVGQIYQQMLQVTGTGYFEAKDYLKVLTEVGAGISDAMKELADDNTNLRNVHTDLSTLDTEKTAREQGIKVESPVKSEEVQG